MKRNYLIITALSIFLLLVVVLAWNHFDRKQGELEYVYDESTFHNFSIDESGYVTFNCDIPVRNRSNAEMKFTMKADVSKDIGLTKESYTYAYEDNSQNYEMFDIASNSKKNV